jgi:hypothetical protein
MLQATPEYERFRGLALPAGSEVAIVAAEAELHGCDIVPDAVERICKGNRGAFKSIFVRTTTVYINGFRCLLKRANVPEEEVKGKRRYAHFDFRKSAFENKQLEFVVFRIACGDRSTFYLLKMEELLEWYGEDCERISLGIPVPEYPIAYCHAGFDWAQHKNAWHLLSHP